MLLRIFLGESDQIEGEPVFRKIVLKAREMNLAGATVLRGPLGFGRSIQEFLLAVEAIVGAGLITLEKVQAIFYRGIPPVGGGLR